MSKPIKCTLVVNTRMGHVCVPQAFDSISAAVRVARQGFGFWYRVFVNGRVVRKGHCN